MDVLIVINCIVAVWS